MRSTAAPVPYKDLPAGLRSRLPQDGAFLFGRRSFQYRPSVIRSIEAKPGEYAVWWTADADGNQCFFGEGSVERRDRTYVSQCLPKKLAEADGLLFAVYDPPSGREVVAAVGPMNSGKSLLIKRYDGKLDRFRLTKTPSRVNYNRSRFELITFASPSVTAFAPNMKRVLRFPEFKKR